MKSSMGLEFLKPQVDDFQFHSGSFLGFRALNLFWISSFGFRISVAAAALSAAFAPSAALARTIVLTDEDCELMAAISADAPRLSWAGTVYAGNEYSNHSIYLTQRSAFLIRYPLDRIPRGQRITKAEWTVPYSQNYPAGGVRVQVRRIAKEWGAGVSWENRMARPQKVAWTTPGAKGLGQDRSQKPTTIGTFKGGGEHTFNVTEDVELWYSGAVKNYGWLLAAEDEMTYVMLSSPFWNAPKGWKLKITFEPE